MILAIDPGPTDSAWVEYLATGQIVGFAKEPNDVVLRRVRETSATKIAIEMIASYGMPVGADVFQTCVFIGRLAQTWDIRNELDLAIPRGAPTSPVEFVTRVQVKAHICHSAKAKDSNVRQALIDRYGPGKDVAIGNKANPGPLYGVFGDVWQALAVAITLNEAEFFGAAVVAAR